MAYGAHGAADHVVFRAVASVDAARDYLHARGAALVGVEIDDAALAVGTNPWTGPVGFLMGNEVRERERGGGKGEGRDKNEERSKRNTHTHTPLPPPPLPSGHRPLPRPHRGVRLPGLHPPHRARHRLPQRRVRGRRRTARVRGVGGGPGSGAGGGEVRGGAAAAEDGAERCEEEGRRKGGGAFFQPFSYTLIPPPPSFLSGEPTLLPHEVDALRTARAAAKAGDWVDGLEGLALE
jgi:hypothetical protein